MPSEWHRIQIRNEQNATKAHTLTILLSPLLYRSLHSLTSLTNDTFEAQCVKYKGENVAHLTMQTGTKQRDAFFSFKTYTHTQNSEGVCNIINIKKTV